MATATARIDDALARIDALHAGDPERVDVGGQLVGAELVYARRMTAWLDRLEPTASEALRLAVRAQHLARWSIPRSAYPEGRAGYRRWRTELARDHARRAAEILGEVGYEPEMIARVTQIITKADLSRDLEVQALEDCACLVFLEHGFDAFAAEHADDKLVDILRKTWKKMSARAREAALTLDLGARARELVSRALQSDH